MSGRRSIWTTCWIFKGCTTGAVWYNQHNRALASGALFRPIQVRRRSLTWNSLQLIAQRYSCKNFGAGKIDAAALHTILEAGSAGTHRQEHPATAHQRRSVRRGAAKIDAATPCRYGAPVCLVVAYDKNHTFELPRRTDELRHGGCRHRGHPICCWALPMCRRGQLLGQLF